MPRFLKQEEITQYAVKNSCPDICWNLYGFPMPSVDFKFEGKHKTTGRSRSEKLMTHVDPACCPL